MIVMSNSNFQISTYFRAEDGGRNPKCEERQTRATFERFTKPPRAREVRSIAEQLPGKAKTALQRVFEEGSKQIKDLIEKVKSNPEVANVIQPKLEEMMNKLKSLTGDTAA